MVANGVVARHQTRIRRLTNRNYTNNRQVAELVRQLINELSAEIRTTSRGLVDACIQMELGAIRRAFTDRGTLRVGIGTPLRQEQLQAIAQMKYGGRAHNEWLNRLRRSINRVTRSALLARNPTGRTIGQRVPGLGNNLLRGRVAGQSEAYVRSYLTQVEATSRQLVRTRNRHLIKAEQYTAILDTRTSTICQFLNGKIVTYNSPPRRPLYPRLTPSTRRPPQHPSCRSSMTPIYKSWRELNLKGLSSEARASLNGQPPARFSYADFLRSRPNEEQQTILGPVRYGLWKNQGIEPEKFINRKGVHLTIEELRAKFL